MDLILCAHVLNVFGGALVFFFSIMVGGRHALPFFRPWSIAFAVVLAFLSFEAAAHFLGRHVPVLMLQATIMPTAGYFLLRTLSLLKGQDRRPGWSEAGLFLAMAGSMAAAAAGAPFEAVLFLSFLGIMGPCLALGWYMARRDGGASTRLVGAALFGLGLWPVVYPYPLLVNTPWAWIGYAGSGLLHAMVGLGMIMFLVDESWRRFREEQEKLDHLRRDLVSIVSHELRTPITTVLGYAEFLADEIGGTLTEDQREYVAQIQGGAERLRRLVDDLLHVSLKETQPLKLKLQQVDLVGRALAVADSLAPQAMQAGVTLSTDMPPAPVMLKGDPVRLEQVALNLVTNAIKFTPEGGSVRLTVGSGEHEAWLAVQDTGIGIADAERSHVFDMFFQGQSASPRARGGAGLGLAIARAIAESHGGRLSCESAPQGGTIFRLVLPLETAVDDKASLEPA